MKTYKIVRNADYGSFYLSRKAEQWLAKRGIHNKYPEIENLNNLPRHEPLLVECVETLGTEYASEPRLAKLEVVIIDSPRYYIANHDGLETIITPENMTEIPEGKTL